MGSEMCIRDRLGSRQVVPRRSYFLLYVFLPLNFLDFKCICKVQSLSQISRLTTVGHPEIGLFSSLLYRVYFVSQYTLCMRGVYASLFRAPGRGCIVEPFAFSVDVSELERCV